MGDPLFPPHEAALHQALGRLVVTWNLAESRVRNLLQSFCGQDTRTQLLIGSILTVELGGTGLSNALQAVAGDILKGEQREAVKHIATMSDLLRSHRNYFVHGLVGALPSEGTGVGFIRAKSAKSILLTHREVVDIPRIDAITAQIHALHLYIDKVLNHLSDPEGGRHPLPDKPPLPESLQKPRLSLREPKPPLQSSQNSGRKKALPEG